MGIGRVGAALVSIALVMASAPAAHAQTDEGFVLLPMATPGFARTLHDLDPANGVTGFVIQRDSAAHEGRRYALTKTEGSALIDLDVYFYEYFTDNPVDEFVDPESGLCRRPDEQDDGNGGETGQIPCRARWAVVVLFTGFDADFTLDW